MAPQQILPPYPSQRIRDQSAGAEYGGSFGGEPNRIPRDPANRRVGAGGNPPQYIINCSSNVRSTHKCSVHCMGHPTTCILSFLIVTVLFVGLKWSYNVVSMYVADL